MTSTVQTDDIPEQSIVHYKLPEIKSGDLRCKRKLGEGGFGVVYKAHHIPNSEDLAVKVCQKQFSKEDKKSVLREIQRMIKTTQNDHIISIRGIVTDTLANNCCIAMDYMEHGSLKSFQCKLKQFPCAVKVKMVYSVTLGMNFLHAIKPPDEPIFHRDLKLENILVNGDLKVKISDFGLATWCTASNFREPAGTITHIPPENLDNINAAATPKYDVYSFGIMLWCLASRHQPYERCNGNIEWLKSAVLDGQRPDMTLIPDDEPAIIKELIEESWKQNPDERPDFKEINRKVQEEFVANYEKDVNIGCADIYQQLASLPPNEDDSAENHVFPWEQTPRPALPAVTHTDAASRVFDVPSDSPPGDSRVPANDKPQSLQSLNAPYSVPVSDTQTQGQLVGMSGVVAKMTGMKLNSEKYGIPDTAPHEQDNPTRRPESVLEQSGDAAEMPVGQHSDICMGTIVVQPQTATELQMQNSRVAGGLNLQPAKQSEPHLQQPIFQPQLQQPLQCSEQQSKCDSRSSSDAQNEPSSSAAMPKPTNRKVTPAESIKISVKGDGNIVTIGSRGSVINTGKQKSGGKSKKKFRSKKVPPQSSSSSSASSDSSNETDSVARGGQSTHLTISNEPVTESIINGISGDIGTNNEALGRWLGLKQALIDNIVLDHTKHGNEEITFQILRKWIQTRGSAATVAVLAEALDKVGLRKIAEDLESSRYSLF